MFSGIVEETGTVTHLDVRPGGATCTVRAQVVLDDVKIGDSIAVNGACLTVVRFDDTSFTVELAPETLRKTALGEVRSGDEVNLERSLAANGAIGGHVVQGHVDATAEIVAMQPDGEGVLATFRAPQALLPYVVAKGYVAVDGMSLTVVDTGPDWFSISFISHTRAVTNVRHYAPGRRVNLEVDVLGKYVEKLLAHRDWKSEGGLGVEQGKCLLWLSIAIFLLLAGPLVAEQPTPLMAVLPAGEVTTIACLSPYGARQNVPEWPRDGIFHYRLYLPDDYHDQPARQYPVMFIAAPGGEAEMGRMAERLTRDRWVVAMLSESRNRSVLWYPNFIATYSDVLKRVRVHPEMLFCTGFSGGARVCSRYPSIRPGFQGLILQAAGYSGPAWVLTRSNAHVTVYGLFGDRDPNRREASRIRRRLPLHTRSLVEIWDGGHDWAPAPAFERALAWAEDKALLEAEYDAGRAGVYEWYFLNKLARFETATSDVERYVLRRLLKTLPERWRLELDDATRARLQAVDSALIAFSEDDALQREIAAHDAFDKALRADEAQRVGDLSEIIQQYGEVADRYPNTQFGQRALMRQQSVRWETGVP